MSRLPKPLFKWKPEMLSEGIYVLQAYNYRISIERAKEIHEHTGIMFAEKILALFDKGFLKERKDALVVASTCIESFALVSVNKKTNNNEDWYGVLNEYITMFGYPDMLNQHETTFREIAEEMKKTVSGRRAKYELAYLTHITKCHCMNFMSRGRL